MKYRSSTAPGDEHSNQEIYSKKSESKTRRETFVGGFEEVENILAQCENDEDSAEHVYVAKQGMRRETCDAADLEAMLQDLDDNSSSISSPYSNLLAMSHSRRSSYEEPNSGFPSECSVNSPDVSNTSNLNSFEGIDRSQLTAASTELANEFNDKKEENTTQLNENNCTQDMRRQTCDPTEMDKLLHSPLLEKSDSGFVPNSNQNGSDMWGSSKKGAASPRRSERLSKSSKKYGCSDTVSNISDITFENGSRCKRRETCDSADIEAMMQDLESNDSTNTSKDSNFSTNSHMNPLYRDIIIHDELDLTSTSHSKSPVISSNASELAQRRSPRINCAIANSSLISPENSHKKVIGRRDTFNGGSAEMEQILCDFEDDTSQLNAAQLKNLRRETAEAGDIERIMKELDEEEVNQKNILGHKANLSSTSLHTTCNDSSVAINCSPSSNTRDSVDTVILMKSVAELLEKVENEERQIQSSSPCYSRNYEQSSSPLPSPLLNISTGTSNSENNQQSWQSISVDDYTMNKSLPSTSESPCGEDDETVNTMDLLNAVRNLVKKPDTQESRQELYSPNGSVTSDLTEGTSFLSRNEGEDSFDDNTVSTMGSLREFFRGSDKDATSNCKLQRPNSVSSTFSSPREETTKKEVGLKSCLSSRKKPRENSSKLSVMSVSAKKRGVVFGSPQAAEFHKSSPVTNFTPMHENDVKTRFSMAGNGTANESDDDELTNENSRILDQWDRLANDNNDGSDEETEGSTSCSFKRDENERPLNKISRVESMTPNDSIISPQKSNKKRKSVASAIPILHNSASLKKNKRRKSRVHISSSDLQANNFDEGNSSNCMSISSYQSATPTEKLPDNLEELMQQSGLIPSPSESMECSMDTSGTPTALTNLVRSAALNASMSMASVNESMVDNTQTLESDLNALMCRVECAGNRLSYQRQRELNKDASNSDEILSETSKRSSGADGLVSLLKSREQDDSGDFYDTPARLRQIAESSSPKSSSDSSMVSNGGEITIDSVISFKKSKLSRRSSGTEQDDFNESSQNSYDPSMSADIVDEDTQELEMDLENMVHNVFDYSQKNQSSSEKPDDIDLSVLTTGDDARNSPLCSQTSVSDDDEVIFTSSGNKGGLDMTNHTNSLNSLDDTRSTVPDEVVSFSEIDQSEQNLHQSFPVMEGQLTDPAETPGLLRKLRDLNAVSRRQSLNYAAHTPMATATRMSVGMKRMSLASQQLESTTKRLSQRFEKRFSHPSNQENTNCVNISTASVLSSTSPDESLDEVDKGSYRDTMLKKFLKRLYLTKLPKQVTESSLFSVVKSFSDSYSLDSAGPLTEGSNKSILKDTVQSIFSEVLSAAIEESTDNYNLMEGDMVNQWHCIGDLQYQELLTTLNDDKESSREFFHVDNLIKTVTEKNLGISLSKWQSWELDLMQVAMEALTAKKLAIREENQELAQKLALVTEENNEKKENKNAKSLQLKLKEAKCRLAAVQNEISKKTDHLGEIQKQCSEFKEEKKNRLVSAATNLVDNNKMHKKLDNFEIQVECGDNSDRMTTDVHEDSILLKETEEVVEEMKFRVNIINKITYCRVLAYKSSEIRVRVYIAQGIFVDLDFGLSWNSSSSNAHFKNMRLEITKRLVVPSFDTEARLESHSGSEKMLAVAYYLEFLSSNSREGPLSIAYLDSMKNISDIPQCLQLISGYVSTLRDVLTWMGHMHLSAEITSDLSASKLKTQWVWGISKSHTKDTRYVIRLRHCADYFVEIPLATLVSGDMEQLPSQFLDKCTDSELQLATAGNNIEEIHTKLTNLAHRCTSPFGSFPIGQIMHAIAPI